MKYCPVSGLPITEKEHWSFEHRQGNYIRKYTLIGNNMLHVQEIADHQISPEQLYAEDFKSLIDEESLTGAPLYLLMDCSAIASVSRSYKKEFTRLLLDQQSPFKLIVLYTIEPTVRLQFEMLQALELTERPVVLAETYEEAVGAILERQADGHQAERTTSDPASLDETALKQEFLAAIAAMFLRNSFDRPLFLPPETHPARPYFQILDLIQQELKAITTEHQHTVERIEQEFRTLLASKNSLLDSQTALNKKQEQRLKDEQSAWMSKLAAQELETTRISTANAEKSAILRTLCELLQSIELDPATRQQLASYCTPLIENSSAANLINTELTETDSAFISKLQKRHPDLNQRELRISLFIKLDYHSREIARSLGLSTRGIESIRYRLHKKIGLDKHRSLKAYLTDLAAGVG